MNNDPEDKQHWREKYLDALDNQELLEQRLKEQQELLRRALVSISIAADGQDEILDQLLSDLREGLRSGKSFQLSQWLTRLEPAAVRVEQHREQSSAQISDALASVLTPLTSLKLARSLKKKISDYLEQLPQRARKIHLYPALLQQLAQLQQQALENLEQPKPAGLLQKILPGKSPPPEATSVSQNIAADERGVDASWLASFNNLLNEFFVSLEAEPYVQAQLEQLRKAFQEECSAEQALGRLKQLRNLVVDAYLAANRAFATYLDQVNAELEEIYTLVGGAIKHSAVDQSASRQLQADMAREMANLEHGAANATDLTQLKQQVKSQLGNIRQALDKYQDTEQRQGLLAQQLNALGEKIKAMETEAEKNRTSLEQQRHKALHDPLTELPNREAYNERARIELQRWERYGRPLTIAIFDIDHFKKINDSYGHQAGDKVIKVIGRSIAKRLREVDFFCRYGGEEFVALMPETSGETAVVVLDKIRDAIATTEFNYREKPLAITISIGIYEFKSGDNLDFAFEQADKALYTAKANGRNICRLA